MKFTYRLQKETSGWLAECVESDAMGEGTTEKEAVAMLRTSLEERMLRPDAVAPPPEEPHVAIDLELASMPAGTGTLEPGGPGG